MKHFFSRFNILALIAGGLALASLKYPWWSVALTGGSGSAQADVFPYYIAGGLPELLGYRRTPQMAQLMLLLGASIAICFLGSTLRGRLGRLLLALAGLMTLLATAAFLNRVRTIAGRFELPLQGHGWGRVDIVLVEMKTAFRSGIYLIASGGVLSLLASLLHPWLRIGGKPHADRQE